MNSSESKPLPSFLCIGAQKAATSWLWVMLRQHPGIWMPPLKEIHYFDHLYIPENRSWTHGHIKKGVADALKWHVEHDAINLDHFKYLVDLALVDPFTESWYRACYDRPAAQGKILGDVTPEYCTLPEEGVRYVRHLLGPDLKLIYIIRNPVQRALSQLRMNVTRRNQEHQGEEFWMRMAMDPVIEQRGDYASYIPRWESFFDPANILYVPYRMIKDAPGEVLAAVERHIGADPCASYKGASDRVHVTRETVVPRSVAAYLAERLAPQNDCLERRFGRGFFEQC